MILNYYVFFGIFLVGILFVPTAEAASEIPAWIKNNAGWWADGQIDDASFLNGIEYLIDNSILEIQSNQKSNENGFVQLEKLVYEVTTGSQIIKVNAFAKFEDLSVSSATIQVTRPDGKIDSENTRIASGVLNYTYMIRPDFPVGEYEISVKGTNNILLEIVSFKLHAKSAEEKAVPTWVKNNAGWWASDTISDAEFVAALQFLVKEGIITTQHEFISFGSVVEIIYKTEMTSKKEPFSVMLIQATSNDACSLEEKRKAMEYGKMSEYLINKTTRSNPTQVTVYCMKLDEITDSIAPTILKETHTNSPKLMIFVGNLEANRELFDDKGFVWYWFCGLAPEIDLLGKKGGCGLEGKLSQVIVCDDCNRWGVNMEDFEDTRDKGMWRLSAAIGGVNFHQTLGDRWDYEAYDWADNSSVYQNQQAFDLCYQFDILENELCSKLYEKVTFLGKPYYVMDISYAKNNWEDEQKEVRKDIISLVGTGSDVEGFSKFTLRVTEGSNFESALASPTREVDVTDILTIEYPNDWYEDHYKYDWSIWNAESDTVYECCHIFQADETTSKVSAELWKDDTRKTGPQYRSNYLASMDIWFLDNVHGGGETDEQRFDALEDSDRKWCSNASKKIDRYTCKNYKVLEKSIHVTDEGRKAYSLLTNYDLNWGQGFVGNYLATVTEIYIGEDAWQIWASFDQDLFEHSSDVVDRFNSSLVILDTTEQIPSISITPKKIVTEDGTQYNANKAWDEWTTQVQEDFIEGYIKNQTNISQYKVTCDIDCKIIFDKNMDVDEVVTEVWGGTDLEYKEWAQGGKKTWDNEKEEWVITEVDMWVNETTSLKKFQNKKLHEQIWDIYISITPKQIIEEIDTFLISTDDLGGGAAFIIRCIDEDQYGCGPPDVSNTKFAINFDPLDMAPTSGDREALLQPGKLRDALEVDMLKGTLIHENAHILSLSASQSDNDMIYWEELCNDDGECDETKVRQTYLQKEFVCAPNYYSAGSGCMKDDSYLNLFFQKFWADIYSEHSFAGLRVGVNEFYQNYVDQFVTYYAITNPAEDFAESFTAFVLWDEERIANEKKVCSEKEGWNIILEEGWSFWHKCIKVYPDNAIWEEKIRFFYDFPELVEMRDFIRSNL